MKALIKHMLVGIMIVMCTAISAYSTDVPDPFGGIGIDVAYSNHGLWNDSATGRGLEYNGIPVSYPGTPWQQVSIAYNGTAQDQGNCYSYTWGLQVPLTPFEGGSGFGNIGSTTVWNSGNLRIMKQESWYKENDPAVMKIDVVVTNEGCEPVEEFIFMHAVDPDQDRRDYNDFRTLNFVVPSGDIVISAGLWGLTTVAYGRCDSVRQDLGHTRWSTDPFAYFDNGTYFRDDTMHFRHVEKVIDAGETIRFSFVFIAAKDFPTAHSAYLDYIDTQCDDGESIGLIDTVLKKDREYIEKTSDELIDTVLKKDLEYIEKTSDEVKSLIEKMEKMDPAEATKSASPNNFLRYDSKDVPKEVLIW